MKSLTLGPVGPRGPCGPLTPMGPYEKRHKCAKTESMKAENESRTIFILDVYQLSRYS